METNKNITNEILKGIQYLIKEEIKKSPLDKTLTGIIKEVKENNLYDVSLGDNLYTNIPSICNGLKINNTVKIKIPQGQYSQMYIEGKYNSVLNIVIDNNEPENQNLNDYWFKVI